MSVMEGSRGTTVVRCVAGRSTITVGAPFSSGSSGNNSSESESLEHLTKKVYKIDSSQSLIRIKINGIQISSN